MSELNPKRRWFRYSIRTILALTLVAGVVFAFIARYAHRRQAALAAVRENGGRVEFEGNSAPSWRVKLLGKLFGEETYQPVRTVDMLPGREITADKMKLPNDFLATVSALSEAESLDLENTEIADDDWKHLAEFPNLRRILLSSSNFTDDGVKALSQLPRLEDLSMGETKRITDAAFASISKMPALVDLNIGFTNITDAGLRNLSPSSNLNILQMHGVPITSHGVEQLKNIPSLVVVTMAWTQVDDEAFDSLAALPNLQNVQVQRTRVTADGVKKFKQSHPKVVVAGP